MPAIPHGYRELTNNEIILATDLICGRGKSKFVKLKKESAAIGKAYRDKATPLFPESLVVRAIDTPNTNVFCEGLNKIPGAIDLVYGLCRKHPIYSNYRFGEFDRRNFYILSNWCGTMGENHIGMDNSGFEIYKSRGVKRISYLELIKLLGGEVPKQKPIMIRLVMDFILKPIE